MRVLNRLAFRGRKHPLGSFVQITDGDGFVTLEIQRPCSPIRPSSVIRFAGETMKCTRQSPALIATLVFQVLMGCAPEPLMESDGGVEDARSSDGAFEDARVADALRSDAPLADSSLADASLADAPRDGELTATCGDGRVEGDEECDDGNTLAGDECSPLCQRAWACPPLAPCDSIEATTTEHHLDETPHCPLALRPWSATRLAARRTLIDAVVEKSRGVVSFEEIPLNREGRTSISATNADRLRNHEWEGFRWNTGDEGVTYWYPQGITGSSDAHSTPRARKYVLVSWYFKSDTEPNRGVRLALADVTDMRNIRYRLLLLVEPTGTVAEPNVAPVRLHAGGIVWWGDLLYVADTSRGLRVFDLGHVMHVPDADDTTRIGISGSRFDAHGYAYAVPELMRYTLDAESCPLRFSFVGLDRSSSPPALVTGEYRVDDVNAPLAVWGLDETTGLLDVREGVARASAAYVSGQSRMQGAVRYEGNLYISSSSQAGRFGRLYRTRSGFGESSISAWVYGAEDLYVDRATDIVWTAAEHPGTRDVVGIPIREP